MPEKIEDSISHQEWMKKVDARLNVQDQAFKFLARTLEKRQAKLFIDQMQTLVDSNSSTTQKEAAKALIAKIQSF